MSWIRVGPLGITIPKIPYHKRYINRTWVLVVSTLFVTAVLTWMGAMPIVPLAVGLVWLMVNEVRKRLRQRGR